MDWSLLLPTSPLWLFFILVLGIIALPGMDMAFVLGSSLVNGLRGGLAATAGVVAGGVAHTVMAGLGVGLALKNLPQLFNGMLTIGALYLAWIGWSLARGATALGDVDTGRTRSGSATFWRGVMTCLLNPKAYLFTAAVFPQFMQPEQGPLVAQAVTMGAIIAATQFAIYGSVALGGVRFKAWLGSSGRAQVVAGQAMGGLLMVGAVWSLARGWQMG